MTELIPWTNHGFSFFCFKFSFIDSDAVRDESDEAVDRSVQPILTKTQSKKPRQTLASDLGEGY